MPRALVLLPESMADTDIAGRTLDDHWLWLCAQAGLDASVVRPESVSDHGGAVVLVDGRFAAVAAASLTALCDGPAGGLLLAPHGEVLAASLSALDPDGPLAEQLDAAPGRVAAIAAAEEAIDASQPDEAARVVRARKVAALTASGVRFVDPARVVVDTTVEIGVGSTVWPGVVLRGATTVGAAVELQTGACLQDTTVADRVIVRPYTVCDGATIGPGARVGPFAHLRAGAVLESDTRVGNFVEVKQATLRTGSKASHLSYLGDADIGPDANIGAGTITCNYDGVAKYRTEIGARVFVGSNCALVAPVTVGAGAIIGAGSVVTRDVPDDALYVERAQAKVLEGKAPRVHARNRARAGIDDE